MHIGLVNWSGHNNLGDDAMARILFDFFNAHPNAHVTNMGEQVTEADAYILGGGTLISPGSLYPHVIIPEKTYGISLGVSSNWRGEHADIYRRMPKIYVRDNFSYQQLWRYDVPCELSVDLCCYLVPTVEPSKRKGVAANIMFAPESPLEHTEQVHEALERTNIDMYFAMSPDEDVLTVPHATVYTDAQQLVNDLTKYKEVVATRLHANVLAWVAGVPSIRPIVYDKKIYQFYHRVYGMTPEEARNIITEHLLCLQSLLLPPQ